MPQAECRTSILLALAVGFAALLPVAGEDLDLTRVRTVDWLREEHGSEGGARVLLSPTADPKELAGILKKSLGVRLSTDDLAHTVAISMGSLPPAGSLTLTQASIDRFRHLVEVAVLVTLPASEAEKRRAAEARKVREDERNLPAGELFIGPAVRVPAKADALAPNGEAPLPTAVAGNSGGNPALFLPAGKLDPGTWWLRVKVKVKEGERAFERPPLTDSMIVKDNRPMQKGEKGRNTPEVGLQPPSSPSALSGLGF